MDQYGTYLINNHESDIKIIMAKEVKEKDYDLFIDLTLLIYEFPEVGQVFYTSSLKLISSLEETVMNIQKKFQEDLPPDSLFRLTIKDKVSVRFINVPELGPIRLPDVKSINHESLNKFIVLSGTIIRNSKVMSIAIDEELNILQRAKLRKIIDFASHLNALIKLQKPKNPIWTIGRKIIDKKKKPEPAQKENMVSAPVKNPVKGKGAYQGM